MSIPVHPNRNNTVYLKNRNKERKPIARKKFYPGNYYAFLLKYYLGGTNQEKNHSRLSPR